jgi:sulfite reductase alpha subunit-like flavoprotein
MFYSRQTILVKIDLGDNRDKINYSPGDHLLLYPKNPESLVQDIVKTLRDVPPLHQLVKIECTENYAIFKKKTQFLMWHGAWTNTLLVKGN